MGSLEPQRRQRHPGQELLRLRFDGLSPAATCLDHSTPSQKEQLASWGDCTGSWGSLQETSLVLVQGTEEIIFRGLPIQLTHILESWLWPARPYALSEDSDRHHQTAAVALSQPGSGQMVGTGPPPASGLLTSGHSLVCAFSQSSPLDY